MAQRENQRENQVSTLTWLPGVPPVQPPVQLLRHHLPSGAGDPGDSLSSHPAILQWGNRHEGSHTRVSSK